MNADLFTGLVLLGWGAVCFVGGMVWQAFDELRRHPSRRKGFVRFGP